MLIGGTQIREIRDRTGARVRVGNEKIAGTNDRPVTIWGTETQIQMVLGMIAEIISRPDDRPHKGGKAAPPPPGYPVCAHPVALDALSNCMRQLHVHRAECSGNAPFVAV